MNLDHSEIKTPLDVSDALVNLRESLLLLKVTDHWLEGLHLEASAETRKALNEIGFLLRTFLDGEPDQVLDRCLFVLDEARKRDRRNQG